MPRGGGEEVCEPRVVRTVGRAPSTRAPPSGESHAPDASAMTAALAASCHAAGPSLVSLRLTPLQSPPSAAAAACWEVLQSAHRRSVIISSEVIVHTNGCTESSINAATLFLNPRKRMEAAEMG
ncbi:hypothetical protein MRX96_020157 [Rhipicephalus microplus]